MGGGRSVVVALGGNAFTRVGERGTYAEQSAHAETMAGGIADLIADGWRVAVVHGNGPQVGQLAIQQEEAAALVPAQPLFLLDAMTEAELGSLLTLALRRVTDAEVACLVTHTVVDRDDPAFTRPSKPIGPFLDAAGAATATAERGWTVREDAGRGYRRVVPSPEPVDVLETGSVRALLEAGTVVVAAGGGGVPVVVDPPGWAGVEAVVDKDLAAERLATAVGADVLAIVTAVDHVLLGFGTGDERPVDVLRSDDAQRRLDAGEFAAGSMAPKIAAAVRFVRHGGRRAVITDPDHLVAAMAGDTTAGTTVVPATAEGRAPCPVGS